VPFRPAEGFESVPPAPAPESERNRALFAIGTGASLGALLAWLNAMM
jgi:hypothetical protein